MFKLAQFIVRHKVAAVAVIAVGVFVMTPSEDEAAEQSSNPWAAQSAPVQYASASEEDSFVSNMVDGAVEYLDEAGMNPVAAADEHVGRLDNAATSFSKANK